MKTKNRTKTRRHRVEDPLKRKLVVYEIWPFKLRGKRVWTVGGHVGAVSVGVVDERKPAALERARLMLGATLADWARAVARYDALQKRARQRARQRCRKATKAARVARRYPARGKTKSGVLVVVWGMTQDKANAALRATLKALGGGRVLRMSPRVGLLRNPSKRRR